MHVIDLLPTFGERHHHPRPLLSFFTLGVRGFFLFFSSIFPTENNNKATEEAQTSTMEVEDGEDGPSAGRGEGGADAPAAGARPSEHAAAPARPASC